MAGGFDIGQVRFSREAMERMSRPDHGLVILFWRKFSTVTFESVALTVGQGAQAVQVMVGEIQVNASFLEAILKTVMEKFEPTTPVTMTFRKAHFSSGHDLKGFAGKLNIDLEQGDVEQ